MNIPPPRLFDPAVPPIQPHELSEPEKQAEVKAYDGSGEWRTWRVGDFAKVEFPEKKDGSLAVQLTYQDGTRERLTGKLAHAFRFGWAGVGVFAKAQKEVAAVSPEELEAELSKGWLGRAQAARVMDVSTEWITQLARQGRLRTIKLPGGGQLYSKADVERLAEARSARSQESV